MNTGFESQSHSFLNYSCCSYCVFSPYQSFLPSSLYLGLFQSTHLLLFLLLLPASWTEAPRESRWKGREREARQRNRLRGKVCYKVPPWVEHGHLSCGWKLKKRLVNLYSWSPWDIGINTAQQNAPPLLHMHLHYACTHRHTFMSPAVGFRIHNL